MKVVIVGAGEVGFRIAKRLASENKDVVVIDRNPAVLQRILDHMDVQVLEGVRLQPPDPARGGDRLGALLRAPGAVDISDLAGGRIRLAGTWRRC